MLQKIASPKSWSLKIQLAMFLLVSLSAMTLLATEWVINNEQNTLIETLQDRSHHTVVLTTQVLSIAIKEEDSVGLESFITDTILLDEDIIAILIYDVSGNLLFDYHQEDVDMTHEAISFTEELAYDGQTYGTMQIDWDLTQFADHLLEHTREARLINDSLLTGFTVLIFLGVQFLVFSPLSILEERIRSFGDESIDNATLPPLTAKRSREWSRLSQSTNQLQTAILQQEQREAELKLARDTALEASNYKTNLLTNVSHELRTPLNGIMGLSELMLTTDLDEEQMEYSESILESGNNLLDVITEMLDYSDITTGNLDVEIKPFNLTTQIESTVESFKQAAAEKNLPISFQPAADLPEMIECDPQIIARIVSNLIDNAVRFTESGAIAVTLKSTPTTKNRHEFEINVIDTGIGICPTALDTVFESFTQADASLTRSHEGNGLGLAIGRGLAQKLGGAITVESEQGVGSTFSFVFSADAQPIPQQEQSTLV